MKDQNGSSSCVGQGTASLAYVVNAFELLPIYGTQTKEKIEELSAKSVYSLITLGYGRGASLRDGVKLMCDRGINTEKEVSSYEEGKAPSEMFMIYNTWTTPNLFKTAQNFAGKEFRTLKAKDNIDTMAMAIRDNKAVILGIRGCNNGTWHSTFPQKGNSDWGHCMLAGKAKVINGKKYIGCLNKIGRAHV